MNKISYSEISDTQLNVLLTKKYLVPMAKKLQERYYLLIGDKTFKEIIGKKEIKLAKKINKVAIKMNKIAWMIYDDMDVLYLKREKKDEIHNIRQISEKWIQALNDDFNFKKEVDDAELSEEETDDLDTDLEDQD